MAIIEKVHQRDYRLYVYGNGILEKNEGGRKGHHKFKTYPEVLDYLKFAWVKSRNANYNQKQQYILVEYTAPYNSKIVKLFEYKLKGE